MTKLMEGDDFTALTGNYPDFPQVVGSAKATNACTHYDAKVDPLVYTDKNGSTWTYACDGSAEFIGAGLIGAMTVVLAMI